MSINITLDSDFTQKRVVNNYSKIKQIFETVDADSCPHSYNFHLHTIYSDGKLTPENLIEQAIAIGLKGLAITDHHTIGGYQVAKNWLENWKSINPDREHLAPTLWSGVEINAKLLNIEVHILGYGFDPEHPSLQPYLTGKTTKGQEYQAANVISAIQQAGGLAVLAHPCRYRRSATDLIKAAAMLGIDGVETYYGYTHNKPWRPSPKQTEQVKQLSATYDLLNTCGTDTHGKNILVRI
ncbi:MAG: PHP domain-containing protein [Okeania sp. SIO3I5]|uniref:PHP domain-containing protein n=1 Tax=Okeania sp. SIO3I5 TaxID=2607805 RepID=UPI0013BBF5E9|nr:PHP domain-containing protein [Okeania sp. SIO3I5]NEQ40679.1 PHP domain-containing protein [Okeania sp. SIO3I5]